MSDYGYEKAVINGILVPYNVFCIETKITKEGSKISLGENVDKRERLTWKKFWEAVDEDIVYRGKQLDKDIVNAKTIRRIIRAMPRGGIRLGRRGLQSTQDYPLAEHTQSKNRQKQRQSYLMAV